jgi:hypothetical protein
MTGSIGPTGSYGVGVVVGQLSAAGPSTVTLIVPVTTFPVGSFVVRLAVTVETPQLVLGLILPAFVTCATSVTEDAHVT